MQPARAATAQLSAFVVCRLGPVRFAVPERRRVLPQRGPWPVSLARRRAAAVRRGGARPSGVPPRCPLPRAGSGRGARTHRRTPGSTTTCRRTHGCRTLPRPQRRPRPLPPLGRPRPPLGRPQPPMGRPRPPLGPPQPPSRPQRWQLRAPAAALAARPRGRPPARRDRARVGLPPPLPAPVPPSLAVCVHANAQRLLTAAVGAAPAARGQQSCCSRPECSR